MQLNEVLDERRKEIKDRQEKEILRLKEDHENELKKMKNDYNRKVCIDRRKHYNLTLSV